MGPVRPSLGTLGPSFGRVWVDLGRPPNLAFIQGFKAFSAMWVLSWLSRPLSGCLGPVPLAQGVGRKAQLRSHMVSRFLVFFVNDAFFPRLRFSSLQGGVKGGSWSYFRTFLGPTRGSKWTFGGTPFGPKHPAYLLLCNFRLFVYRSS